ISLNTPFGTYEANCILDGQQLVYTRKRVVNSFSAEADQYDAFRNYLKQIRKYDNARIVLVKIP
ncbi:MAG: hypothetical protein AAF598_17150, partial [Bacteroidota bacterium]